MEIKALENGPLIVSGEGLVIAFYDGDEIIELENGPVALCRCGASNKKPLCDGSHKGMSFECGALTLQLSEDDGREVEQA